MSECQNSGELCIGFTISLTADADIVAVSSKVVGKNAYYSQQ